MENRERDVAAIATLDEPVRRRLYDYIAAAGRAVGRDEAAAAVGIGRSLAAFHLDRLAAAQLLEVEYRRLSGKTGRGAGRPNKLYRRAAEPVGLHLPPRRYELAASIMADALEAANGRTEELLRAAAGRRGRSLGQEARARAASRETDREPVVELLGELGFEPRPDADGAVRLGNCPFRALVPDHRDVVCGMNVAFVEGLIEGLGSGGVAARLDPQPEGCCVAVSPRAVTTSHA